ncbi:hypothetical protein AL486_19145 [Pandoraea apista]|nr:hypothetical protein AL486_19145 [Pandoraea apista]
MTSNPKSAAETQGERYLSPEALLVAIAHSPEVRVDRRFAAVEVLHQFRLGAEVKVCISCGMPQNSDGTLPCDH